MDETRGLHRSTFDPKIRSMEVYQQHLCQKDPEAVFWIYSCAHFRSIFEQKTLFVPKQKQPEQAVRPRHSALNRYYTS